MCVVSHCVVWQFWVYGVVWLVWQCVVAHCLVDTQPSLFVNQSTAVWPKLSADRFEAGSCEKSSLNLICMPTVCPSGERDSVQKPFSYFWSPFWSIKLTQSVKIGEVCWGRKLLERNKWWEHQNANANMRGWGDQSSLKSFWWNEVQGWPQSCQPADKKWNPRSCYNHHLSASSHVIIKWIWRISPTKKGNLRRSKAAQKQKPSLHQHCDQLALGHPAAFDLQYMHRPPQFAIIVIDQWSSCWSTSWWLWQRWCGQWLCLTSSSIYVVFVLFATVQSMVLLPLFAMVESDQQSKWWPHVAIFSFGF